MIPEHTCDTCAYWHRDSDDNGTCRHCSPLLVYGELNAVSVTHGPVEALWPSTSHLDWCGDWASL